MMEASANLVETASERHASPYRKMTRAEAGRLGGVASGISRRLRGQRALEEKIAASRNGQALYHLLRLRLEREQELAAARIAADRDVVEAELWALQAKEDLEAALSERAEVEQQLERQRAELRSDEQQLEALLRSADERGLLAPILERLDFELREVDE